MDLMLHDIPEAVDRALKARAKSRGTSISTEAVAVLSTALGEAGAKSHVSHEPDQFFGTSPDRFMTVEDQKALDDAKAFMDECGVMSRDEE
jgi:plasmid stability protein